MDKLKLVEATQMKTGIPPFAPGDTVNVHVRVVEGDKERIQQFQGVVIGRHGAGMNATFTVSKISDGVGRRAHLPAAFAPYRKDRERKGRRGSPRETLLPPRPRQQSYSSEDQRLTPSPSMEHRTDRGRVSSRPRFFFPAAPLCFSPAPFAFWSVAPAFIPYP